MERIDKINAVLAAKGMTGAELSRLIGVSNSIYSQWNTYKVKVGNKNLAKIADALKVPVASLLADGENKKSPAQADSLDGVSEHIISQLPRLSSDQLKAISDIVDGLLK